MKSKQIPVILYLIGMTGIIYWLRHSWSYDDPYITYRYAANLARGLGFVYNSGQHVLSTTTPLFAILLASLRPFWSDLPHLANLIGVISLAIGAFLLWDLANLWKTPLAGWICLLLYPIYPLVITTLGSETPLYLALTLGAFDAYARKRYSWAAAWAGLVILARPDGALVPFIMGLDYLIRVRKSIPWAAVAVFLSITLAWFVFGLWYFGSPLPVTLFAKQQQGVMTISQRFFPGFLALVKSYSAWEYLIQAGLSLLGLVYAMIRRSAWLLLISWTILYFIAYTILGVSRYFWYYAPLAPGFILTVGLGVQAIWETGKRLGGAARRTTMNISKKKLVGEAASIFPIGLIVLLVSAQAWNFWIGRAFHDTRMEIYRQVGQFLASNTPSDVTVGALEVGSIGYYSDRTMIDFAGLIQPEIARQMTSQSTYANTADWAVENFHPNYLVLPRHVFPVLEQGYAASFCVIERTFWGKDYHYSGDLDIYSCRSVALR